MITQQPLKRGDKVRVMQTDEMIECGKAGLVLVIAGIDPNDNNAMFWINDSPTFIPMSALMKHSVRTERTQK